MHEQPRGHCPRQRRLISAAFALSLALLGVGATGAGTTPKPATVATYPRLDHLPDPIVSQIVNDDLERREHADRREQLECGESLVDYRSDVTSKAERAELVASAWVETVTMTYLSARLLSLRIAVEAYCGGTHPDTLIDGLTYDLKNGRAIDWAQALKPGVLSADDRVGELTRAYRPRHSASREVKHGPDSCWDFVMIDDPFSTSPRIWIEQAGIFVSPKGLPQAFDVCAEPVRFSLREFAEWLRDPGLAADFTRRP